MTIALSYKPNFPTINFIGNKEKLDNWIYDNSPKRIKSVFDAFCGGCSVSFLFKKMGKKVISNDVMMGNFLIAKALIENKNVKLTKEDFERLIKLNSNSGNYITSNFSNVLYLENECKFLDNYRANMEFLSNDYKRALSFLLIRRAMIRKMPYSRFNLPWKLIKMLRNEEISHKRWGRRRAYHNMPFEKHLSENFNMYNSAVFDNGEENKAMNFDVIEVLPKIDADMVYFDPPYAGKMNDYYSFYGFLDEFMLLKKMQSFKNDFTKKENVMKLFEKMFLSAKHIPNWILSYNSRAYPTKEMILELLKKLNVHTEVLSKEHAYKLTGSDNKKKDMEYLFIVEV